VQTLVAQGNFHLTEDKFRRFPSRLKEFLQIFKNALTFKKGCTTMGIQSDTPRVLLRSLSPEARRFSANKE
jgi:hypothetical protein